jgi:hypothetical protein
MTRRIALLYGWCELAAIEFYTREDPASAERLMRRALAVTR